MHPYNILEGTTIAYNSLTVTPQVTYIVELHDGAVSAGLLVLVSHTVEWVQKVVLHGSR